ncbi:hypothetical protein [Segetibacter sp.]|jgi:hypothetical protein|uniref:hypothetical protein n=1 Tax=Segetibacter sp. TaxID=2231182 RepID=UPI00261517AE|nr:hypothetical protein [Segetibacter sp.]
MKQNSNFTFCYFIYISLAIFIHPIKAINSFSQNTKTRSIQKQVALVAVEQIDVLHGELFFKF